MRGQHRVARGGRSVCRCRSVFDGGGRALVGIPCDGRCRGGDHYRLDVRDRGSDGVEARGRGPEDVVGRGRSVRRRIGGLGAEVIDGRGCKAGKDYRVRGQHRVARGGRSVCRGRTVFDGGRGALIGRPCDSRCRRGDGYRLDVRDRGSDGVDTRSRPEISGRHIGRINHQVSSSVLHSRNPDKVTMRVIKVGYWINRRSEIICVVSNSRRDSVIVRAVNVPDHNSCAIYRCGIHSFGENDSRGRSYRHVCRMRSHADYRRSHGRKSGFKGIARRIIRSVCRGISRSYFEIISRV